MITARRKIGLEKSWIATGMAKVLIIATLNTSNWRWSEQSRNLKQLLISNMWELQPRSVPASAVILLFPKQLQSNLVHSLLTISITFTLLFDFTHRLAPIRLPLPSPEDASSSQLRAVIVRTLSSVHVHQFKPFDFYQTLTARPSTPVQA